ncbi:MAG: hypothetical protein ROO70_20330 [Labrenzia sp.]
MARYYVSVTGLRLKTWFHAVRFWRHAVPSFNQAKADDGNILTDTRTVRGVHHTLTVWTSETAMKRYLYRGAHRQAIKAFPSIATGSTCGYQADDIPSWQEALEYWERHGRSYETPITDSSLGP